MGNAIANHGRNAFKIEQIATAQNQTTLDYLETFWINTYDSIIAGYNIKQGGSHGKLSAETKRKISESLRGKPRLDLRKPMSEAHKQAISESRKGSKHSDDHKAKISASLVLSHKLRSETKSQ